MKYAYVGDRKSVDLDGVVYPVGVFIEVTNRMTLSRITKSRYFKAEIVEDEPIEKDDEVINIDVEPIIQKRRGRKPKAK